MADPPIATPLTPDAYLAMEAESGAKHEYVRGEVFAMSGASDAHNDVASNVHARLRAHLRGKPCRAQLTDVKLRVEAAGAFFYPDVFVTCAPSDLDEPLVKRSAVLVVEVLSASTADYDRGDKFADYRRLPDLREYVLVDSRAQRVEVFRRNDAGRWERDWLGAGNVLTLESIGLTLAIAAIYDDTSVPEAAARCA